ncbi:MAG: hypothetical protein ACRCZ2_02895 [Fusobacteriaceae bacterium]
MRKQMNFSFNAEFLYKFKLKCLLNGVTQREVVEEMIRMYTNDEIKLKVDKK